MMLNKTSSMLWCWTRQIIGAVISVSGSSEKDNGLAEPFNKSATWPAPVQSAAGLAEADIPAPKGLPDPSKTASKSKGLAGPLKTAEGKKR